MELALLSHKMALVYTAANWDRSMWSMASRYTSNLNATATSTASIFQSPTAMQMVRKTVFDGQ